MADLVLSDKYKAFLRCDAPVEFLEGTTAAGKTTVALFKFILRVAASSKWLHILSGLDKGTIEKNMITKELGLLDNFGDLLTYHPGGRGTNTLPHMLLHTSTGDKTIYVMGYADKARWKKALGGQYGCLYIDEINIADIDFVREASMRCDYLLGTLNPDDPSLPIYAEYINHARPLGPWTQDTPGELLEQLSQQSAKPGWVHWFFSFEHNLGLSKEKAQQIISNVPTGTKLYKNKILGLRGRATGLIFDYTQQHRISIQDAKQLTFVRFSAGLDTAYSQSSADSFAFIFLGITNTRKLVILRAVTYNNRDLQQPITPSDIPKLYLQFLQACRNDWGFARDAFIDSADQATILECQKYCKRNGSIYNFLPAWKKTPVLDRIQLQKGWMAKYNMLVVEEACQPFVQELNTYSWQEDKYAPEDAHDHCINGGQYAWLPFKKDIGGLSD